MQLISATFIGVAVFCVGYVSADKCYACQSEKVGDGAWSVRGCPWEGFSDAYEENSNHVYIKENCDYCQKIKYITESNNTETVVRSCLTEEYLLQTFNLLPEHAEKECELATLRWASKDLSVYCCKGNKCNSASMPGLQLVLLASVMFLAVTMNSLM